MNLTEYTILLSKPESVNDKQTAALDEIVTQFPFFQSARALRLKGLYNQGSYQYNYALKVTAAYTTDRSVLFDFITSDTFTAIHKGLYEQKLAELYGIEVRGIEHVTKADTSETDIDKVEKSILTSIKESEIPFSNEIAHEEFIEIIPEEIAPEPVEITAVIEEVIAVPEEVIRVEDIIDIVENPEKANAIPVVAEELTEMPEIIFDRREDEITTNDRSAAASGSAAELSEAKLEIGRPLEFSKDEKHSFQEWLQLSRFQPIVREEIVPEAKVDHSELTNESEVARQREKKKELIDQFIKANPKIPPVKQVSPTTAVPELIKEDTSALMTETLARVYLEQKKYQKAIQAYEILILKYPEKSTFFADRISEVKNLQQNNL